MRYFLSSKEQKSAIFVKEEFLYKKIQKNEFFFWRLDYKLTERKVASLKQYGGL